MNKLFFIFLSLRPNAWIRIAAEILLGAALVPHANTHLFLLCIGFCILGPCVAGASYVLNDITDKKYDGEHPLRRERPIAKSLLSLQAAWTTVVILSLVSLVVSFFISFPFFIFCCILLISESLYTMHPFRFKEIAFLDMLSNAINAFARFSVGFYLAGGNISHFPFFFAAFAVLTKVLLFLGHRMQSRNQEMHFHFKSTVVVLPRNYLLFLFLLLGVLSWAAYCISVFEYSLPLSILFYPLFAGVFLLPIIKTVFTVEKKENIRNYLYIIFFLFSLLIFLTAQMIYNKLY